MSDTILPSPSNRSMFATVSSLKRKLNSGLADSNTEDVKSILNRLRDEVVPTGDLIRITKIGVLVGRQRQSSDPDVSELAKLIVKEWKYGVKRYTGRSPSVFSSDSSKDNNTCVLNAQNNNSPSNSSSRELKSPQSNYSSTAKDVKEEEAEDSDYIPASICSSSFEPKHDKSHLKAQNPVKQEKLNIIESRIDLIDGKLIVKSNFKKQKIEGSTGDRSVEKGIVNEERKKFHCDWLGCGKSYSKPIRLVEHKRSHTNERPYRCPACPATYRRETHLTAHMRMHLPEESKPFQCNWKDTEPLEWSPKAPESLICNKRFWTKQHLRVHVQSVHEKKKSQPRFSCEKCCQTFTKHHLLKTHFAEAHCPPNTKPFQCDYEGCSLSFLTCSKLRKHQQTHEPNRYSCVHEDCLSKSLLSQLSFPTWTKLQAHNRLCHPLRCEVEGCSGGSKTYKSPKSLSNHMINHHHRSNQSSSSNIKRPDLKISYKTALKTFRCAEPKHSSSDEICGKSYQSARSLQRHIKIIHSPDNNGHRVTCPIEGCNFCSSYPSGLKKHILTHERHPETKQPSLRTSKSNEPGQRSLLTGNIYYGNEKNDEVECLEGKRSDWTETSKKRRFGCPLVEFENQDEDLLMKIFSDEEQLKRFKEVRRGTTCLFRFNRVYDLQRHLRADHSIEVDRETLKSFFSSQS